jgi:hypothetical protein
MPYLASVDLAQETLCRIGRQKPAICFAYTKTARRGIEVKKNKVVTGST